MDGLNVLVTIKNQQDADLEKVVESLLEIDGVEHAYELSGGLDIMLRLKSDSASDAKGIMESINAVSGVETTNSYLIIGERK
jgi:DNA-binding Lrp family transcriptional regulator